MLGLLDALVFSGGWVALAAAVLAVAVSHAFGALLAGALVAMALG